MSQTDSQAAAAATSPFSLGPVQATRIDSPHGSDSGAAAANSTASLSGRGSASEFYPQDLIDQVQSQAEQLASHLQRQKANLDRREAQLNAQWAAVESEIRSARLWLAERQEGIELQHKQIVAEEESHHSRTRQLDDREAAAHRLASDLDAREKYFAEQLSNFAVAETVSQNSLTAREAAVEVRLKDLEAREEAVAAAHSQLDQRQAELEATAEQLREAGSLTATHQAIREKCDRLSERETQLESSERILRQQMEDLELQRVTLRQSLDASESDARAERQKLVAEQRRVESYLKNREELLDERLAEIEARRVAAADLRNEALQKQRETLQWRLATQELWTRMQASTPTAELTAALSQARLLLAQQYRIEQDEIAARTTQLGELSLSLKGEEEALLAKQQKIQAWLASREDDLARRSATLAEREADLARLAERMRSQETSWVQQRYQLQSEIRRLQRYVRRDLAAA